MSVNTRYGKRDYEARLRSAIMKRDYKARLLKGVKEMLVVKVGNLSEFMQEVRAFSDVRLSSHEVTTQRAQLGELELCLDLMGFNEQQELVWLHYGFSLQLTPGSREPWTESGKAAYAAFPGLVELMREYLAQHYSVRPGMYGVPQEIAPLGGDLEIARWDGKTRAFVRVEVE